MGKCYTGRVRCDNTTYKDQRKIHQNSESPIKFYCKHFNIDHCGIMFLGSIWFWLHTDILIVNVSKSTKICFHTNKLNLGLKSLSRY